MLELSLGVYFRQWLGFTSKSYTVHLSNFSQTQQFAGIGAHHHNGVAEKAIQTIMSITRTMILQSAIHWPKSLTPSFGPWQSSMPPISTTRFQIPTQVSVQMISSPRQDGSKGSFMTFMFGVVHSMVCIRRSLMARNSHIGNQELLEESSWV